MKLELNDEEVNIILAGLGELKAKVSFAMISRLRKEYAEQADKKKEK